MVNFPVSVVFNTLFYEMRALNLVFAFFLVNYEAYDCYSH
jgi:hypothetical protein